MPEDTPTDPQGPDAGPARAGADGGSPSADAPAPSRLGGPEAPPTEVIRAVPAGRDDATPPAAPGVEPGADARAVPAASAVGAASAGSAPLPAPTPGVAVDPNPTDVIPRVTEPLVPTTRREARLLEQAGRRHRHRWLRRSLAALLAVVVFLAVGGFFVVRHLNGNIRSISIAGLGGRPTDHGIVDPGTNLPPMNILLMGSDTRAGADANIGEARGVVGARSDVTMIAHLAANRKSATVVSIPRDTMVKGPISSENPTKCDLSLPQSQWTTNQFNSYYEFGGPTCTIKVVETMTGVYMDHFATVDFAGFKNIVNALGTVQVCLTAPVKDPASGADFPAGWQRLNGDQALAFVRLRHAGDGSDTSRIKRQQDFLSSVVREATSAQVLANPAKLYSFLDASTKSLTTDSSIGGLQGIGSIALSARDIPTDKVRFVSMPWQAYPRDPNRIQAAPAAKKVWQILRTDAAWPGTVDEPTPSVSASSPTATATIAAVLPKAVTVDVVNASSKEGLGKQTADALKAQGFVINQTTSQDTTVTGTVIHYAPADKAKATEVAAAFTGATLKADGTKGNPVKVVVGMGASKVKLVPNAASGTTLPDQPILAPPPPSVIESKTANQNVCTDTSK